MNDFGASSGFAETDGFVTMGDSLTASLTGTIGEAGIENNLLGELGSGTIALLGDTEPGNAGNRTCMNEGDFGLFGDTN